MTLPAPDFARLRAFVAITPQELGILFSPEALARLHALADIRVSNSSYAAEVPAGIAHDYDVLVTSWSTAPLDSHMLLGDRLGLLIHAGGSVRNLVPYSTMEQGLRVSQGGAEAMAASVSEFCLALTLALLRNLHTHDRGMSGRLGWDASGHGMLGHTLSSRRIGIVGLSRTGTQFATMVRALGCTAISAYDPFASSETAKSLGVELRSLHDVVSKSDVVAVHVPSIPQTRNLMSRHVLASMGDGTILINTARSSVIDSAALLEEVSTGRIRAALDVFDDEPLPAESPFMNLPGLIATPHVAGGTVEARWAQGEAVVAELRRYAQGEPLWYEIKTADYDRLA